MRAKDLRDLKQEELKEKLDSLKKDLFSLRFKRSSGELKSPLALRNTKRDIARVLTVLNQKESGSGVKKEAK